MFNIILLKPFIGAGSGGFALTGDMGLAASYSDSVDKASNPAECLVGLYFYSDGTWEVKGSTPVTLGNLTLATGFWGNKQVSGAGRDYEIKMTVNSGSPASNMTSSYTSLVDTKYAEVTATDTTLNNGGVTEACNITIDIRKIGSTTPVLTDTTGLSASANYTNV